uniref:Uncharacterized protein n=1 Tax=Utricularia reniformis TaxID=192314 RepID=A0A1Y0B2Q0_9LAMI|nr:hypothetical protein AEK19_MT1436 [Utricularia reniformis]ART31629.1 hypothetical protein AEK19_MT1436 [Utricularia reniformis]
MSKQTSGRENASMFVRGSILQHMHHCLIVSMLANLAHKVRSLLSLQAL